MNVFPLFQTSEGCNTYVVSSGANECVVIDAGAESSRIQRVLSDNGLQCTAILLTHGHFDHIQYLGDYVFDNKCKAYIHSADACMLTDPDINASAYFGLNTCVSGIETYPVLDGEEFSAAGLSVKVLHTPGHTPGSVCYMIEDCLFSGDTLFCRGIGRWDLPGGDRNKLLDSLRMLTERVNGGCRVYPGHGYISVMSDEKAYNPYLRGLKR